MPTTGQVRTVFAAAHTAKNPPMHLRPMPPRLCPSLVALAVLAGCGSDGSGTDDEPGVGAALPDAPTEPSDAWSEYGPFQETVDRARSKYRGANDTAEVDVANVGPLFDTIVRGPFASAPSPSPDDPEPFDWLEALDELGNDASWDRPLDDDDARLREPGGVQSCDLGGTRELTAVRYVDGESTSLVIEVRFDECTMARDHFDSYTVDGGWSRTVRNAEDPDTGHFAAFDSLSLVHDGLEYVVDGAIRTAPSTCSHVATNRATLLIEAKATGTVLLMDDVVSELVGAQPLELYYCLGGEPSPNRWSGAIAHGEFGRVELRTPTPLHRVWNRAWQDVTIDPEKAFGDGTSPRIELTGAAGTAASLEILPSGLVGIYDRETPPLARLRVRTGDRIVHEEWASVDALASGAMADLLDADGDGLPNAWELTYGLDPESAADAVSDADRDRVSALAEYVRVSDPTDLSGVPGRLSQTIEVSLSATVDPDTGATDYAATVRGERSSRDVRPLDDTFALRLAEGGEWDEDALPVRCTIGAEPSVVRCAVPDHRLGASFEVGPIAVRPDDAATLVVDAEYAPFDTQLAPETSRSRSNERDTRERAPDFVLTAPARVFGSDERTRTVLATIVQPVPRGPADLDVRIDVPERVVVQRAELLSDGPHALVARCTVGEGVVCTMPGVRYIDALTLQLDYRVLEGADSEMTWRLEPSMPDATGADNALVARVTHQSSMTALQALVDGASEGDTIVLPAGTYAGTLDGRGLGIEIRGASGEERTVLVSTDPETPIVTGLGQYATVTDVDWRTTGAPIAASFDENVTFARGTIEPVEGVAHDVDDLIGDSASSYRMREMTVRGFGGPSGECRRLFSAEGSKGAYETLVYMQRNTFVDNDCDALFLANLGSGARYGNTLQLFVDGNTFVDNPNLLEVRGPADAYARLSIRNNVMVGATRLLEIDAAPFSTPHQGYGSLLVAARNLVWQSERESVLRSEWLDLPNVELEATDLSTDPEFVDAAGGDFALRAASPAIDAGISAEPYRWSWDEGRHEFVQPGSEAVVAPLDGDGDGEAQHDIGALEYRR